MLMPPARSATFDLPGMPKTPGRLCCDQCARIRHPQTAGDRMEHTCIIVCPALPVVAQICRGSRPRTNVRDVHGILARIEAQVSDVVVWGGSSHAEIPTRSPARPSPRTATAPRRILRFPAVGYKPFAYIGTSPAGAVAARASRATASTVLPSCREPTCGFYARGWLWRQS